MHDARHDHLPSPFGPVDHPPGLADVIGLSLSELAELDNDQVTGLSNRLLPDCATLAARSWQNNGG
jgi:hypothetical protein